MSRHLLPKLKEENLSKNDTGKWIDFANDFKNFPSQIDVSNAEINITSIPSPWARMLLFKEAILDRNHVMHLEVMSNILDVIEIIYYKRHLNYTIKEVEIDLTTTTNNKFIKILNNLNPEESFTKITIFILETNSNKLVLAGTSPYTLFFTPKDIKGKLGRYFQEEPVLLKNRPKDFQQYFNCMFLKKLREHDNKYFKYLVDAFQFENGICSDSITEEKTFDLMNSDLGTNDVYLNNLLEQTTDFIIESPLIMKPSKNIEGKKPLVIDVSTLLKGKPYYNRYNFKENYKIEDLKDLSREYLPGENVKYPWVLPYVDFLQPIIIKYKYKLNDELLVLGKKSDDFKYALPLSDKFFDYFTPADVDKYLSITSPNSQSIKVILKIPLESGQEITIERNYSRSSIESQLIEYDDKDWQTPLPYIIIWPKLNPKNWKDSYYGFIYRKEQDLFTLDFMDEDKNILNPNSSYKSDTIEIFKIDKLPTYVNITRSDGSYGKLIIDPEAIKYIEPKNNKAKVGIDFGTSHTTVAIKVEDDIQILKYSSEFKKKNLNTKDFFTFFEFSDKEVNQYDITQNILQTMDQFFLPNCLSDLNSDYSVNLPIPSMLINEEKSEVEAILKSSINFSKDRFFEYSIDGRTINKSYSEETQLKWSTNSQKQKSTKEYVKIFLLLIKYELIKREVILDEVKYFWAYPKSFSQLHLEEYNKMWGSLINRQNSYNDESKATLLYFNHKGILARLSPEISIVIDIGGGSSDISVWQDGNILLLYSTLWAGRNLVGYKEDNKVYSSLYHLLNKEHSAISNRYKAVRDFMTHLNFILCAVPDDKLLSFIGTDKFWLSRFIILYFYSILFYEIGIQCRRLVTDRVKTINVCLAGNGARFINWSSGDFEKISSADIDIYQKVIVKSLNLDSNISITFTSSKDFKNEVAIGLCCDDNDLRSAEPDYKPIICEDILIKNKKLNYNTSIEEFDSLVNNNNQIQVDFHFDNNNSELIKFNQNFFNILESSQLYKERLCKHSKLENLSQLKSYLLDNWDLIGTIRDSVYENERHLNTVTCSLFIIGMQLLIKRLHKYLNEE